MTRIVKIGSQVFLEELFQKCQVLATKTARDQTCVCHGRQDPTS